MPYLFTSFGVNKVGSLNLVIFLSCFGCFRDVTTLAIRWQPPRVQMNQSDALGRSLARLLQSAAVALWGSALKPGAKVRGWTPALQASLFECLKLNALSLQGLPVSATY